MDHATDPPPAPATHTKQYVFVDEYNRHRRLKVMRACDGCRKRKIRCDGALQYGPWPCGACVRLKLKCVPPALDQGDDQHQPPDGNSGQQTFSFPNTPFALASPAETTISSYNGPPPQQPSMVQWTNHAQSVVATAASSLAPSFQHDYAPDSHAPPWPAYQQTPGVHPIGPNYPCEEYFPGAPPPQARYQQGCHSPSFVPSQTEDTRSSSGDPQDIEAGVRELSEHMGDLKIDITCEAPYIKKKHLAPDAPAIEEAEVVLPASVMKDSMVRIPAEMMPSEERAMDYFGYYFAHIHPYCAVLNRARFYEQWRTNRKSISPLLLEAIFGCVARYLEEPAESRRWLALAARHEESFKDVPRLDTVQALVILMKARESIAKRGYYYRSWMTVRYMVTMAMDLDLHEHHDQHVKENTCILPKTECMLRTRIWQTLFIHEIMVGAPLGRSDFQVDIGSVTYDLPLPSNDVDAFEHVSSRRTTIFAQAVRNIKESNNFWLHTKKHNKDWALDPTFVRHNEDLPRWVKTLPSDFQLQYPEDGSLPWLGGDHYVANVHVYHHLVVIMHHRPQLQARLEKGDQGWKDILDICLSSASQMCRVQEALHRDFGFHGLQFMTRGVNFTIYCVLTCTMLHLAAITCPDPMLNAQARLYFTRHMRVLEHCLPSANAEMQAQINALREAFSADITQPFELRATLGLRSPTVESHPPPSSTGSEPNPPQLLATPAWNIVDTATPKSMNPADGYGVPYDTVTGHGMCSTPQMPHHSSSSYETPQSTYAPHLQQVSTAQTGYALEPVISNEQHTPVWDPSGIFNQWNAAFGGGPAPQATPPDPRSMQPTSAPMLSNQTSPINTHNIYRRQQVPVDANPAVMPDTTPPAMPMVTPVMWQDAFTNAYVSGHGQKRYREVSVGLSAYNQYPNTKRRG